MTFLNGYKTYIVSVVAIIAAWVAVWNGTLDFASAWISTQAALSAMTIRHGVATTVAAATTVPPKP